MQRDLMTELVKWKGNGRRKPLILNGARQVGKTWLLKEFGRTSFENVAYVNLDDNPAMKEQFELGYDIPRIESTPIPLTPFTPPSSGCFPWANWPLRTRRG